MKIDLILNIISTICWLGVFVIAIVNPEGLNFRFVCITASFILFIHSAFDAVANWVKSK